MTIVAKQKYSLLHRPCLLRIYYVASNSAGQYFYISEFCDVKKCVVIIYFVLVYLIINSTFYNYILGYLAVWLTFRFDIALFYLSSLSILSYLESKHYIPLSHQITYWNLLYIHPTVHAIHQFSHYEVVDP